MRMRFLMSLVKVVSTILYPVSGWVLEQFKCFSAQWIASSWSADDTKWAHSHRFCGITTVHSPYCRVFRVCMYNHCTLHIHASVLYKNLQQRNIMQWPTATASGCNGVYTLWPRVLACFSSDLLFLPKICCCTENTHIVSSLHHQPCLALGIVISTTKNKPIFLLGGEKNIFYKADFKLKFPGRRW